MINITDALALNQYCDSAADEIISDALTAYAFDYHIPLDELEIDQLTTARHISLDLLESFSFGPIILIHDDDGFFDMILTYELISIKLTERLNCDSSDIGDLF